MKLAAAAVLVTYDGTKRRCSWQPRNKGIVDTVDGLHGPMDFARSSKVAGSDVVSTGAGDTERRALFFVLVDICLRGKKKSVQMALGETLVQKKKLQEVSFSFPLKSRIFFLQ
jgi:hypothetical protein